jgi:hypothetical protein
MFRTVRLSIVRNLFTVHSAMVYGIQVCRQFSSRSIVHSTQVESGLQSALNLCTVQTFTESEDTRCCVNTIFPPEDVHVNARNMSRILI